MEPYQFRHWRLILEFIAPIPTNSVERMETLMAKRYHSDNKSVYNFMKLPTNLKFKLVNIKMDLKTRYFDQVSISILEICSMSYQVLLNLLYTS